MQNWGSHWGMLDSNGYGFWFEGGAAGPPGFRAYAPGPSVSSSQSPTWVKGTYKTLRESATTTRLYYNEAEVNSKTGSSYTGSLPVFMGNNPSTGTNTYVDWVAVLKYANPGPTWSS